MRADQFKFSRIWRQQRGGVLVLTALLTFVLVMVIALAMEVFRMLASRIQMENISEYMAEVDLSALINAEFPPSSNSATMSRLISILNNNYFIAQAARVDVDNSIICDSGTACGSPIKIVRGCYDVPTAVFNSSTTSCVGGTYQAVYVSMSTFEARKFQMMLAKILGAASIDLSARALSYYYTPAVGTPYVITCAFKGTLVP